MSKQKYTPPAPQQPTLLGDSSPMPDADAAVADTTADVAQDGGDDTALDGAGDATANTTADIEPDGAGDATANTTADIEPDGAGDAAADTMADTAPSYVAVVMLVIGRDNIVSPGDVCPVMDTAEAESLLSRGFIRPLS